MGADSRSHPGSHLTRSLVVAAVVTAVALLALGLYADFGDLGSALADFRWQWLPGAIALTGLNYVLRFLRWHWYLARVGIEVPVGRSLTTFLAGMAMTLTPGKVGEGLKCVLLRRSFSVPIARSAPIIFAERLTDLFAVALLAALGAVAVGTTQSWPLVAVTGAGVVALAAFFRSPLLFRLIRLPDARDASARLFDLRSLAGMSALATISWFSECLAAYICFRGLGIEVSVEETVLTFALASLAGALSFLPGGLGVTEASMTALLRVLAEVPRAAAVAGTVLARLVTLWFGVAIGLIALFVEERMSRRMLSQEALS